jgi:hypothetical protein
LSRVLFADTSALARAYLHDEVETRTLRGLLFESGEVVVASVVDLDPPIILPCARDLVLEHRLGTLHAIHLAVAVEERRRSPDPVVFVTRDADQAAAARALGFPLL